VNTVHQLADAHTAYLKRFGSGVPQIAARNWSPEKLLQKLSVALDTGQPVPEFKDMAEPQPFGPFESIDI
jgi:hypothetical protein